MYEKFPIPLINRLEKHFVLTSSILEDWQEQVLEDFQEWIRDFSATGYIISLLLLLLLLFLGGEGVSRAPPI